MKNLISRIRNTCTKLTPFRRSEMDNWTKQFRPRQARALEALLKRPHSREELDKIIGTSNSPNTIFQLRRRGFVIPLAWRAHIDRDGCSGRHGVYSLSEDDLQQIGGTR